MKLKSLILAALAATASAAFAADSAPLTFNGVLTLGRELRFGLVNVDATHTGWVKIGGEFDGYTIKSYDAATHVLSLEREGKSYSLTLADQKLTGAATEAATKATLADAEAVFEKMQIEEMLGKTLEKSLAGQSKMMAAQMEKQLGGKVSPEDLAEFQKKMTAAMLEAMNPEQMKKDMVKIYADLFTKEELSAMAAFNSTPAGKAMIEKQPEMQGRLQELMMPRMMSVGPAMQKLAGEFHGQQKAKIDAAKAAAAPASAPEVAAPAPAAH